MLLCFIAQVYPNGCNYSTKSDTQSIHETAVRCNRKKRNKAAQFKRHKQCTNSDEKATQIVFIEPCLKMSVFTILYRQKDLKAALGTSSEPYLQIFRSAKKYHLFFEKKPAEYTGLCGNRFFRCRTGEFRR